MKLLPLTAFVAALYSLPAFLSGAQAGPTRLPTATISGGSEILTPSYYDVQHGPRYDFPATLLPTGTLFLPGGCDSSDSHPTPVSQVAELYDPLGIGSSARLTPLQQFFYGEHSATLLPSGKILVAGGTWFAPSGQVELYDPSGPGSSVILNPLVTSFESHSAARLPSGQVLFLGLDPANHPVAELYDPAGAGSSRLLTPPSYYPNSPGVFVLGSGKVLIIGGVANRIGMTPSMTGVQLYDPTGDGSTTPLAPLLFSHPSKDGWHDFGVATLLPGDRVLLTGGSYDDGTEEGDNLQVVTDVQVYDPADGGSSRMLHPLYEARTEHTATLLPSGEVLVAGGTYEIDVGRNQSSVELVDPTGALAPLSLAPLHEARMSHSAVLLSSGDVLMVGGFAISPKKSVERYTVTGEGSSQ